MLMKSVTPRRTSRRIALCTTALSLGTAIAATAFVSVASAQGFGESRPWQFDTSADKVNKAYLLDLMERKRGGYFDSFQTIVNTTNNTYIDHQINCSVSATSVGNTGTNAMDGSAASPVVTNTGTTSANTTGNQASNGITNNPASGIVGSGSPASNPSGAINNNQGNTDSELESGVYGSETEVESGPIRIGSGRLHQVLNSDQDNTGDQTASVSDSTACSMSAGPIN